MEYFPLGRGWKLLPALIIARSVVSIAEAQNDFPFGVLCPSWTAGWQLLGGDVPAGAAVGLPLRGARLLEGTDSGGGAGHHPWLHHDNRDILQGTALLHAGGAALAAEGSFRAKPSQRG